MSRSPRQDGLVPLIKQREVLVALFLIGVLSLVIWVSISQRALSKNETIDTWDAIFSITCNLLAATIGFLVVVWFLQCVKDHSRETQLHTTIVEPLKDAIRDLDRSTFSRLEGLDWGSLFEGTQEVYLLVQGWSGWDRRVGDHLSAFLRRGGRLNVILHDPNESMLVSAMAARMGRTEDAVKEEISGTLLALRKMIVEHISDEQAQKNQFRHVYTKHLNWFCGIYFKPNKLLLSLYQHHQKIVGQIESPSFIVRTDVHPDIGKWFETEWSYLWGNR